LRVPSVMVSSVLGSGPSVAIALPVHSGAAARFSGQNSACRRACSLTCWRSASTDCRRASSATAGSTGAAVAAGAAGGLDWVGVVDAGAVAADAPDPAPDGAAGTPEGVAARPGPAGPDPEAAGDVVVRVPGKDTGGMPLPAGSEDGRGEGAVAQPAASAASNPRTAAVNGDQCSAPAVQGRQRSGRLPAQGGDVARGLIHLRHRAGVDGNPLGPRGAVSLGSGSPGMRIRSAPGRRVRT
jgi:hypothetical protein